MTGIFSPCPCASWLTGRVLLADSPQPAPMLQAHGSTLLLPLLPYSYFLQNNSSLTSSTLSLWSQKKSLQNHQVLSNTHQDSSYEGEQNDVERLEDPCVTNDNVKWCTYQGSSCKSWNRITFYTGLWIECVPTTSTKARLEMSSLIQPGWEVELNERWWATGWSEWMGWINTAILGVASL